MAKAILTSAKDFFSKEITVGDFVIVHSKYGFKVGEIIRFATKMVMVSINSAPEVKCYPIELIKMESEQAMWYLLNQK
jgi:hypothetical protein